MIVTRYLLDSSVFINGWQKHYHPNVFPSLWERLGKLIETKVVFSCDEVYKEIEKGHDDLFKWVKKRKEAFDLPTEAVILEMRNIMKHFANFAAKGSSKNSADPWIIAHAKVCNAIVVTDEQNSPTKSTKPPKIPNVCDTLGITWMNPLEFFQAVGFSF